MTARHETFEAEFPDLVRMARQVALRIVRNADDADDVAIEVLARAHQRWGRIEPYATRWVCRAATNLAIDRVRRGPAPVLAAGHPAEDVDVVVAGRAAVADALRSLPERQRQVVTLTVLCDLTMNDAAAVLGISPGAVKQHSRRALAALRARLAPPIPLTDVPEPTWTPTT